MSCRGAKAENNFENKFFQSRALCLYDTQKKPPFRGRFFAALQLSGCFPPCLCGQGAALVHRSRTACLCGYGDRALIFGHQSQVVSCKLVWCRRWESNPHSEEHGPKPCAYANSATPACGKIPSKYNQIMPKSKGRTNRQLTIHNLQQAIFAD